jgi:hypothetical protein
MLSSTKRKQKKVHQEEKIKLLVGRIEIGMGGLCRQNVVPCQTRTGGLGISAAECSHRRCYETHVITNYTKETA